MALQVPMMQQATSNGIDPSQAFATTNPMSCSATATSSATTTPTFPRSMADRSASLVQQEEKPSLLPLQVLLKNNIILTTLKTICSNLETNILLFTVRD